MAGKDLASFEAKIARMKAKGDVVLFFGTNIEDVRLKFNLNGRGFRVRIDRIVSTVRMTRIS